MIDPTTIDFVIYHKNCADGFGAAYAAWKVLGNTAEYFAASHGAPPPNVEDKIVAILDFSYDNPTTKQMIRDAQDLIVIDHHASAVVELSDIPNKILDMSRSGAKMAWDFFHPDTPAPALIKYIQDRDLWQWRLSNSQEFCAALDMVPFNFQSYSRIENDDVIKEMIITGGHILASNAAIVRRIIKNAGRRIFHGYRAMVVNSSWGMSEIGSELAKECDVAVIWYYNQKRDFYKFSLRTRRDDVDVSILAGKYGGGGHTKAAGFAIDGSDELDIQELFKPRRELC
jgi:oligoribonuclease NrnB/cAMP/cGMP phosphodiesterase (DHH superfamily)